MVGNPASLEQCFLKGLLKHYQTYFLVCWQLMRKSNETAENYSVFQ